ncbi:MAG: glycerol-3-phosphate 1-O-acyltransferase PlsY [Clostridia bacterium]|nr:glycerol-3-phosphate 1-O-acyltransferase PlsY [Clostridia bacterium]
MILTAIITIVAAYLIGSINFAVIFSKLFSKADVREAGSGNAGATNVLRTSGVLPGVLTFICDLLKGVVSSAIGLFMFSYLYTKTGSPAYVPIYGAYACGVACMIGHVFPVFFDFRGGKGVAVGAGVFFVCSPYAILIGLAVFVIFVLVTKIVSLASLAGTVATVVLGIVFNTKGDDVLLLPQIVMALSMGVIIFLKHTSNIKRIISGEEKKINSR